MRPLLILRDLTDRILGPALHHYLRKTNGFVVASGPFRGMQYLQESVGSMFVPKIMGSYEKELNPTIEGIIAAQPSTIVDIGCAEGYYAVGLAIRLPATQVMAFEMEEHGRRLARNLAELNHVSERVRIEGRCDPEALSKVHVPSSRALVICDVEGYETELLTTSTIQVWRDASFLIEAHDFLRPGTTEQLKENFSATHDVQIIPAVRRRPQDLPIRYAWWLRIFGPKAQSWCLSERRAAGMVWIYAAPRSEQADGGK